MKVKSFTITEILVVIVITSVVVSLALSVLRMLQRHTLTLSDFQTAKNELYLLNNQLAIEFSKAESIHWSSENEILTFTTPLKQATIAVDSIALSQRQLEVKERTVYLQGKEKSASGIIDALKLEMNVKGKDQTIFVYRRNDLNTILNHGN